MPIPETQDIIWIAGFYEGEGSAGCYENRPNQWTLHVSLTQKERQVLDWVREQYGFGSIYCNRQRCHHWQCYYEDAKIFLLSILPYMKVERKIQQVELALSLADKHIKCGRMTGLPTNSKLTHKKVKQIRELARLHTQYELAELYKVVQPCISRIVNNLSWI